MQENEQELIDSTNDAETTENTEEVVDETTEEVKEEGVDNSAEIERLRKENETLKIQKEKYKKKATEKKPVSEDGSQTLSPKDYLALQEASIKADDFEEVQNWAEYKKVSIAEALKDKTLRTILNERAEERRTAEITNTKGGQRGAAKPSIDTLLSEADKGTIKETDIDALAEARMKKRLEAVK